MTRARTVANLATSISVPGLQEQLFTSSGTWTAPTGVTKAWVLVVGGGGSGHGAASTSAGAYESGWAGAQTTKQVTVSPGTGYNIVVGGGGPAANSSNSYVGQSGVASSFDVVTAAGGPGGQNYGNFTGGYYAPNGQSLYGVNGAANSGSGSAAAYGGSTSAGGSGFVLVRWLA